MWAESLPSAFFALASIPYEVKLVDGLFHKGRGIGQDTGLEISVSLPLHAEACTCEVG